MNQVLEDLKMACKVGYGCGLETVQEAISNVAHHYDAFFRIEEANQRLGDMQNHINLNTPKDITIRNYMGEDWWDQVVAEEVAYWEANL